MRKVLCGIVATVLAGIGLSMEAGTAAAASPRYTVEGSCSGSLGTYGAFTASTHLEAEPDAGGDGYQNHTFAFGGFLSPMEDAEYVKVDGNHTQMIFQKGSWQLAVPFIGGSGLWFADSHSSRGWQKLCSY